jgi:hypothetical protein
MHLCSFTLNDQPTSAFEIAGRSFRAFSGLADHANKRRDMCVPDHGPIPIGTYYIVDRDPEGAWGGCTKHLTEGRTGSHSTRTTDESMTKRSATV